MIKVSFWATAPIADSDIDFSIGFQPLSIYELFSMIDGDEISMSFVQPLSPSIMYGIKENEKYLMLPARFKSAA